MGTNTGTVMTLANSIIGVGVLAMPFCFKQCGIVLSIVMLLLSSVLSRLACHFLLKAAIMARRRNFEFLAFHTFGPSGKTIVELCIIGFLMGTCIAFFVVVGDLGPVIVAKALNINNTASLRQSVLVGLALFVVLPLGLLRNVDSLTSVCTASIGFYLCLVMKVMAEAMPHLVAGDWVDKVHLWRPAGMLQCIPIFSMALFCQTQLFEIYESLPNASLDKMNEVIRAAVNLCTGFYICVGFFGYVAFCTQSFTGNVLMSFTPSLLSDVMKMGFVLSVGVSFPLVIFPCRASLYSLLFKRVQMPHHESTSSHIPETRFKCLTIGIISASLTVGLLIPNIELVLGLVGSTIGVLICVMFPAVAFICISTKSTRERLLAQVLVFVGVLILVLGTYATLYAANEAADTEVIETVSIPSDHLDSVVRMTMIQVDKPVVENIVSQNDDSKLKAKVNDKVVESKQELPGGDTKGAQDVPKLEQKEPDKIPDVRQEPPVPVEPPADNIPPVVPSVPPVEKKAEKKEADKLIQNNKQIEKAAQPDTEKKVNKEKSPPEDKKMPSPEAKGKGNSEQVNQDAIKKEDEELAEAEKQAEVDNEKKNEELLRKLEEHQEAQKKLLQEQKQILEELKEHKKEIEQAAAMQRNDPHNAQSPAGKNQEAAGVNTEVKNQPVLPNLNENIKKESAVNNAAQMANKMDNKSNIPSEIKKPLSDNVQEQNNVEKKDTLHQSGKAESPKNFAAETGVNVVNNSKNLNNQYLKQGPLNLLSPDRFNAASVDANKSGAQMKKPVSVADLQQARGAGNVNQNPANQEQRQYNEPVPIQNKLPLPIPLAVLNNASRLYKQGETNTKEIKAIDSKQGEKQNIPADEAKVMRRDILANDKNGLKANLSQEKHETNVIADTVSEVKQKDILADAGRNTKMNDLNNEIHDRMKRDTLVEETATSDKNLLLEKEISKENDQMASHIIQKHEQENCDVDKKVNQITEKETLNLAMLSKNGHSDDNRNLVQKKEEIPLISNKHNSSLQESISKSKPSSPVEIAETVPKNVVKHSSLPIANISVTNTRLVEDQALHASNEDKIEEKSRNPGDTEINAQESVTRVSSIIKTPSHLSDPKIDDDLSLLNEAAMKVKDVSVVAKPMTRDLKSIPSVQKVHEDDKNKDRKDP
ncbi:putative sodium-coupled neutral amino acid transporter 10 [Periplaneta americana]|uniref:putative sodium-coupled neutral amino acid transporter 10 n=1 Tax=Periplaneta americana TaxID=6978 RepID=UPI0037E8D02E